MSPVSIECHPHRRGVYRLTSALMVEPFLGDVFAFFSTARNLEQITPSWMRFHIITPEPIEMRQGVLIDYRLKVHGIPLKWQSEITEWQPPHRFVDVQRKGPFRLWHHEHTFEEREGGTLVRDQIDYTVPGGSLVHSLFVRRDLESIFRFRTRKLAEVFRAFAQSK